MVDRVAIVDDQCNPIRTSALHRGPYRFGLDETKRSQLYGIVAKGIDDFFHVRRGTMVFIFSLQDGPDHTAGEGNPQGRLFVRRGKQK